MSKAAYTNYLDSQPETDDDARDYEPDPLEMGEFLFTQAVGNVADFCSRERMIELLDRAIEQHEKAMETRRNQPVGEDPVPF